MLRKSSTSSTTTTSPIQEAVYHHTIHCADFLTQVLLCPADSSLIFKDEDIKWPSNGGILNYVWNLKALRDWTSAHDYISEQREMVIKIGSQSYGLKIQHKTSKIDHFLSDTLCESCKFSFLLWFVAKCVVCSTLLD